MELLIKIPKEFDQHFKQDAFEDSLHRLSADAHLIAGLYEQETAKMLIESFKNAVPIPAHGRLGDLDELARKIEHDRYNHTHTDGMAARHHIAEYGHFLKEIANIPTIIPADPAEGGGGE